MKAKLNGTYKSSLPLIDIFQISKLVLRRLSALGNERHNNFSEEQLIFPQKIQVNSTKYINRISEQELRLLFIEEFVKLHPTFYYSIETPTIGKFYFGKTYEDISAIKTGQSASLDMCIFERDAEVYKRILNIEFKHRNSGIKNTGKDILKLIKEKQDGAFIHLLENTNIGTICNDRGTGIFNKLHKCFHDFQSNWVNDSKSIQIIIFSLKQNILLYRNISKKDLMYLKDIFYINNERIKMSEIKENGWQIENFDKNHLPPTTYK
ncbi:hypothetical protein [Dokdonia sp. R86516]|uniref:hypothetical protein n=1 Tax=Dokdonia sp. R86516 TaxID=3093856 RepID=UPI0037CB8ABC